MVAAQTGTSFSSLQPGTYELTETNASGCVSAVTTIVIDPLLPVPLAPSVTHVDPTCTVLTGSVSVTSPVATSVYTLTGITPVVVAQTGTIFTSLQPGTYELTETNASGCVSVATTIVIDPLLPVPVAPSATHVDPTCTVLTGSVNVTSPVATSIYTLTGITPAVAAQTGTVFSSLQPGTYELTETNASGCISVATTIVIDPLLPVPLAPSAILTQPTCLVPSGTITFVTQPNVEYSVDGINFQSSEVFSNLSPNTYTLTVRNTTGAGCSAVSLFPVTINAVPSSPPIPVLASVLQPTCSVNTGTITFVTQPNVEYSIDGITFRTSEVFSNLPPNTYNLTVRSSIERNCITTNPIPVTINSVPTSPNVPVLASVLQPTCSVPSGTITFVAQPNVEYSIDGVTFQSSEVFTNLSPNTYDLTVRSTIDISCTAISSVPVTINSVPTSPNVPVLASVLQPTCSVSSGTITFVAQPNVEYSIDGVTFQSSEVFPNLSPDTYGLTVRSTTDISCAATSSVLVTINSVPTSPNVPVLASVLQPTCSVPSGTITFVAQPNVEYSIDGITFQSSEVFPNLSPDTYDLTVRSTTDISCAATSSVSVTINSVPTSPNVPVLASVLQPTCSVPSGTITFVAQPNVEYSIDGVTFQSSEVFMNLSPNTYDLTVRSTTDISCTATNSVPVTINAVPTSPNVPVLASVLQPTCSVITGTITFVSQPNVEYSIDGVTFQSSEVFSNLSPNTYSLTVRSTTDISCTATSSVPVTINSVPTSPSVPVLASVLQPTCSVPSGTITFVAQSNVEYSIDGVTFQSSEVFMNLSPNTYNLTVRSTTDISCTATNSVSVTINSVPTSPNVPVLASVIQPTCSVPSGTITFVAQPNVEYSIDGVIFQSSEVFTNLSPNTYDLTVRSTTDISCTATSSVPVIINTVPTSPSVPILASVLQPTCSVPSGTITFVIQPNVEYSVDGVIFQSSEVFTNLSPNTYDLTVRSTIDISCTATNSVPVTINSVPTSPNVPVLASVLQPTCSVPSGTITFVAQPNVEYSIDGVTFQSSEVFTNLSPNTYNLTVRSTTDISCTATSSVPVTINTVPAIPIISAAVTIETSCNVNRGEITVSQPLGSNFEYSIDGVSFQSSNVFTNLLPDTYTVTVRDVMDSTCSNTTSLIINPSPIVNLVITCPPSITLECGDSVDIADTGIPTVNSSCGDVVFTFVDSNLINGCNANTGVFRRTFTGVDEQGNSTTCTQEITIEDTIPPVFSDTISQNVSASCNTIPEVVTLVATDNCGGNVTITFNENEIRGECASQYIIERVWTATDLCGNESLFTQQINVFCPINVYNGVSFNNDGANDFFLLEGIECYVNNTVKIFNRWGVLVFETENYDNDENVFKGISEGRLTIAQKEKLPTGTYFYVINYEYPNNGNFEMLTKTGYLYISD
ncbi:gliding motility-associated C-terminal domain-containing protein [Tenacibaculum sp. M341]|nr:gliding motility-associated C-terminal domain-containing protein [Tenacibaculum sp. M341]